MLMFRIRACAAKAGMKFRKFFHGEKGAVNIVAMVILIAIVVLLAVFFRKQIVQLVTKLFEGINSGVEEATTPIE